MTTATIETRIWLALKARVEALPTSIVPQDAISYPAAQFEKPTNVDGALPYIQVHQLPNQSERQMINRPVARRPGILQLDYLAPLALEMTHEQMTQKAGEIAQHFVGQVLKSDTVQVHIEQVPDVGRALEDRGYWRIPISIRYLCFA